MNKKPLTEEQKTVLRERLAKARAAKKTKAAPPKEKMYTATEVQELLAKAVPVAPPGPQIPPLEAEIVAHQTKGDMNINQMADQYGLEPYEIIGILQKHGYRFKEGAVLYSKNGELPDRGRVLDPTKDYN